jgi:hypothetical protein
VQIDCGTSQETQDSEIQESDKYIGLGMRVVGEGKRNSCKTLGVDVARGNSPFVDSTTQAGLNTRHVAGARPPTTRTLTSSVVLVIGRLLFSKKYRQIGNSIVHVVK